MPVVLECRTVKVQITKINHETCTKRFIRKLNFPCIWCIKYNHLRPASCLHKKEKKGTLFDNIISYLAQKVSEARQIYYKIIIYCSHFLILINFCPTLEYTRYLLLTNAFHFVLYLVSSVRWAFFRCWNRHVKKKRPGMWARRKFPGDAEREHPEKGKEEEKGDKGWEKRKRREQVEMMGADTF